MIYVKRITTQPNVTALDPTVTVVEVDPGIIHLLEISFPPGAAGLLHLTINRELHQVWPSNPDADFAWDSIDSSWPEWYSIEAEPLRLLLRTWNDDDTYAHDVVVRFALLPRDVLERPSPEAGILTRLERRLFGSRGA